MIFLPICQNLCANHERCPMNHVEAEAFLRNMLVHINGVWIAHVPHGGASREVEISIRGGQNKPDEAQLTEAAACVASLAEIVPRMERALNSVPESDPLFPAIGVRSWSLEGLSFLGDDPARCIASFALNENGYDFIYVEYLVELERGQVVSVRARTY